MVHRADRKTAIRCLEHAHLSSNVRRCKAGAGRKTIDEIEVQRDLMAGGADLLRLGRRDSEAPVPGHQVGVVRETTLAHPAARGDCHARVALVVAAPEEERVRGAPAYRRQRADERQGPAGQHVP